MKMTKGGKLVMVKKKAEKQPGHKGHKGGLPDPVMQKKEGKEVAAGICTYSKGKLRNEMLRKSKGKRIDACGGPKKGQIRVCGYEYKTKKGKTVKVKGHCRKLRKSQKTA